MIWFGFGPIVLSSTPVFWAEMDLTQRCAHRERESTPVCATARSAKLKEIKEAIVAQELTDRNLIFFFEIEFDIFSDSVTLWKAQAEPKVIFFAWTAIPEILTTTTNNQEKKGWQHNSTCPLCQSGPEM
jgi:hypothetical protein